ncbi:MAG: hypothetical protein ABW007_02085 [Chitinophagaceae bacterium]
MGKKEDISQEAIVKVIGAVAIGIFVVKPLLNFFGGNDDDRDTVREQLDTPLDESPFSREFIPYLQYLTAQKITNPDEYWAGWKWNYDNGMSTDWEGPPNTLPDLVLTAEQIYYAFGLMGDSADLVFYLFGRLADQVEVAMIAGYLWANYQVDLLAYLKDGSSFFPWNGLSDSELSALIKQVNNLPVNSQ